MSWFLNCILWYLCALLTSDDGTAARHNSTNTKNDFNNNNNSNNKFSFDQQACVHTIYAWNNELWAARIQSHTPLLATISNCDLSPSFLFSPSHCCLSALFHSFTIHSSNKNGIFALEQRCNFLYSSTFYSSLSFSFFQFPNVYYTEQTELFVLPSITASRIFRAGFILCEHIRFTIYINAIKIALNFLINFN